MATERFDLPAHARLNSISDELRAMNTLIIANVTVLPTKPELVDQLIQRCDEMLRELRSIRISIKFNADGNSASRESTTVNSGGQQA